MHTGLLDGKTILITGAGSGIGAAAADLCAREGATLALLDRSAQAVANVAAAVHAHGGQVITLTADIGDETAVAYALREVAHSFGTLDGAFNNAGTPGRPGGILSGEVEDWRATLDTNVLGMLRCMRHEIPIMRAGAAIVNTTSLAGLIGAPHAACYAASKHAVIGLTRSAALEYGSRGLRVNAIAPGPTRTAMLEEVIVSGERTEADFAARTALGRMADPQEIAEAALWLLSPRSSYVTGHVLVVDGGQMAS